MNTLTDLIIVLAFVSAVAIAGGAIHLLTNKDVISVIEACTSTILGLGMVTAPFLKWLANNDE